MGRSLLFGAVMCAILLAAATTRSDVASGAYAPSTTAPSISSVPEPITNSPAVSAPGNETQQRDPFTPYDIGSGNHWRYEDLSAQDKALVDKGRDTAGWDNVHAAYGSATKERARQAAAEAAVHELGIVDNLAAEGVVP